MKLTSMYGLIKSVYYTYPPHVETELKPVIASVRGYSLHSAKHQGDDIEENNGEPVHKKAKDSYPS